MAFYARVGLLYFLSNFGVLDVYLLDATCVCPLNATPSVCLFPPQHQPGTTFGIPSTSSLCTAPFSQFEDTPV